MKTNSTFLQFTLISAVITLALLLAVTTELLMPSPAKAWPEESGWIHIDYDGEESDGNQSNRVRDVIEAWLYYDTSHLYLRLETRAPADTSANRYKWFINDGSGSNLYQTDGIVDGSEFLLLVQNGNIYLQPAVNEAYFGLTTDAITNADDAEYQVTGNYIDMKISFDMLGNPSFISVVWGTDHQNPNLAQAPTIDRADSEDTPNFTFTRSTGPSSGSSSIGVPAFPSIYVGIASSLGVGILAHFMRRRLVSQKV